MFDKVIFAGGGHRCWWQAGFWEVLRTEIELRPRVIGAVSMGAFMACLVHANDSRRALAWYERELSGVRTNLEWKNLFRRGEPFFRQGGIYRKALRALLGGEHFRQLMWQAPEIRVAYAIAPAAMSERQAMWHAWREYRRDARLAPQMLHPLTGNESPLLTPGVKRLQDCRSERELVELLMASSAVPPLFPVTEIEGERTLSGELIDPVPVGTVADVPGQTLVLTTRTYDRKTPVFALQGRIYVQPSVPVLAGSWDFTSPRRFLKTWEQGRADAEAFLKLFGLGAFQGEAEFGGALLAGAPWPGEQPPAAEPADDEADTAAQAAAEDDAAGSRGDDGMARAPEGEDGVPGRQRRLPDQDASMADDVAEGADEAAVMPASRGAVAADEGGDDAAEAALGRGPAGERPMRAMPGYTDRQGGVAEAGADEPQNLDPHTLGELSDKLFERGRRAR